MTSTMREALGKGTVVGVSTSYAARRLRIGERRLRRRSAVSMRSAAARGGPGRAAVPMERIRIHGLVIEASGFG